MGGLLSWSPFCTGKADIGGGGGVVPAGMKETGTKGAPFPLLLSLPPT